MKYALLINTIPGVYEGLDDSERQAITAEYMAIGNEPACSGGAQLHDGHTATTVRVQDGQTLTTDGPFADTKEVFAGYFLFDVRRPRQRHRGRRPHPRRAPGRLGRGAPSGGALALLERVFRDEWGRVLASLIGLLGDFDLAEEATQEAFTIAAERWPRDGTPSNPGAWLTTTARNRAIDRLRRARVLAEKTKRLELPEGFEAHEMDDTVIPDERLELVFTCCHPALSTEAQVALTLHALGGLTTEEIARAFLVSPETMKRRLTRAKSKIKTAGIPFSLPSEHLLPERLAAVLAVIYLIFNQGYSSPPEHAGLAREAIRLGGVLAALMPDEPEVHGLQALMLLNDSRRDARNARGEIVLLADQDRTLWDHAQIARARLLLDRALALRGQGPYVLQAAIASLQVHDAPDWVRIESLYRELAALTRSPVVELNRAVAVAECQGPAAALAIVDRLELDNYQYLHSTRAELLRRLGRRHEARAAYERALELTGGEGERRFLRRRLAEL